MVSRWDGPSQPYTCITSMSLLHLYNTDTIDISICLQLYKSDTIVL